MISSRLPMTARQSLDSALHIFTELQPDFSTYDKIEMRRKATAKAAIESFRDECKNMTENCGRVFAPILPSDETRLRKCRERCDHFSRYYAKPSAPTPEPEIAPIASDVATTGKNSS